MAQKRDATDVACEEWAKKKREMIGLNEPALAKGFLGPLRCTLGQRRDLHHGSRSGRIEQHVPDYPFIGEAWVVNQAWTRMPEILQVVLVAHYVVLEPKDRTLRADLLGIGRTKYWKLVALAKSFVTGAKRLTLHFTKLLTTSVSSR